MESQNDANVPSSRLACDDNIIQGLQNVIKSLSMQCVNQQDELEEAKSMLVEQIQLVAELRTELTVVKDELRRGTKRCQQSEASRHAIEAENTGYRRLVAEADAQVGLVQPTGDGNERNAQWNLLKFGQTLKSFLPMQRNSALHQVSVVNERLELTQQSNMVLQQQIDLFSVRYQMVLEDLRKESIKASDAEAALAASGSASNRCRVREPGHLHNCIIGINAIQ